LAEALPIVWRQEPSFTMVWAGQARRWTANGQEVFPNMFAEYSRLWGEHTSRVLYLGEIEKPHLYAVLKRADATVLPSACDNLPNTAIESLSLGVPVIGTAVQALTNSWSRDIAVMWSRSEMRKRLLKS